jgi:hypothetical protein
MTVKNIQGYFEFGLPGETETQTINGNLNVTGAISGRGVVPLGAIIPIAQNITGSFTIPASGLASNGYQLCDGVAVASGLVAPALTGSVPQLNDDRFLMGASTAGVTGGFNSITPAGTLSGSQNMDHTHNYSHTHGTDTYSNTLSLNHTHTQPAHRHDFRFALGDNNYSANGSGGSMGGAGQAGAYRYSSSSYSGAVTDGVTWGTTINLGTATVASVGRWYSDGDTGTAAPTTDANLASYNISHSHTTNSQSTATTGPASVTTVNGSSFTFNGTSQENRPKYLTVRYLIRVN